MIVWYEVRCCCRPEKLLGWLPAPEGARECRWAIVDESIRNVVIGPREAVAAIAVPVRQLRLPIMRVTPFSGASYDAIKAEGVTIEELRQLHGFKEAAA